MTDRGVLTISNAEDLSVFVVSEDGYSALVRGTTRLFPVLSADGVLFFSRRPLGNGAPGNVSVLVTRPE